MKKWEEEQRQKAHVKRVIAAKPTLSNRPAYNHFRNERKHTQTSLASF